MANPGKHVKRPTELWAQYDFDEVPTRSRNPRTVGRLIKGRRRYSRRRTLLPASPAAPFVVRGARR